MDADCALCSWGARMIHRFDRSGAIRICPSQSPLGAALMRHYGLQPEDPRSWLLLDAGLPYQDFDAILHMGQRCGGWARLIGLARIIPKRLRNKGYRWLARNRHAIFGRADKCAIPDPAFQRRLLR